MAQPLINGQNYAWAQVAILIGTNVFYGITKISYKRKRASTNNMGIGDQPISIGYGNVDYEASISMYLDDWKRLCAIAPDNDPTLIAPFTVKVAYGSATNPTVDKLYNFRFLEDGSNLNQGDTRFVQDIACAYAGQQR